MAGFVKVANEVFTRFRKMTQRHIAVRLYELGDMQRWKSFECSDSYLMEDGVSKRDVRKVITALQGMGLLVIVSPGNRQNSRVIRVIDPSPKKAEKVDHDADHGANHDADHGNNGKSEPIKESGPRPEPRPELKYQTPDKTSDSDSISEIDAVPASPSSLSPRVVRALKAVGLDSTSAQLLSRSELLQRDGLGKKTVDALIVWLATEGKALRPDKAKAKRASGDPRVRALGNIWSKLWKERRGTRYSWDWHKDANHLARFGECAGWDEDVFSKAVGLYLDAEDRHEWPDRAAGIAKAAFNAGEWVNGAINGEQRPLEPGDYAASAARHNTAESEAENERARERILEKRRKFAAREEQQQQLRMK